MLLVIGGIFTLGLNIYIKNVTEKSIFKNVDDIETSQVALVLGAKVFQNGRLSDMYYDRALSALELYQKGKVGRILVSGDHGRENYDEVNTVKQFFLDKEVAEEDIFLDHAGFDTYDSIYRAKEIFKVKSVVIVTQEFHLPRALFIAQRLDLEVQGLIADKQSYITIKYNKEREILANVKAFLNIIGHSKPKYLGKPIPILGDGRGSWD